MAKQAFEWLNMPSRLSDSASAGRTGQPASLTFSFCCCNSGVCFWLWGLEGPQERYSGGLLFFIHGQIICVEALRSVQTTWTA